MTGPAPVRTLHVVAPGSLRTWFRFFVDDPGGLDHIFHAGENPQLAAADIRHRVDNSRAGQVVLHSSHETLLRDCRLAGQLRAAGLPTLAQSSEAARLGVDKFRMRTLFEEHGFSALRWWRGGVPAGAADADRTVVVKARSGTQSIGARLADLHSAGASADEFCEAYADGVEYSVLVHRDQAGHAVLPPVWKGPTSRELVPPWRRLRLCPDPFGPPGLADLLCRTALATAAGAQVQGWTEVELLVTADGAAHVLEINPRVSGTMRIAALATGLRLFSLHRHPELRGRLPAVCRAAEVPYQGPPITDPARRIFGTSRLTVAAETHEGLLAAFGPAIDEGTRQILTGLAGGADRRVPAAGVRST